MGLGTSQLPTAQVKAAAPAAPVAPVAPSLGVGAGVGKANQQPAARQTPGKANQQPAAKQTRKAVSAPSASSQGNFVQPAGWNEMSLKQQMHERWKQNPQWTPTEAWRAGGYQSFGEGSWRNPETGEGVFLGAFDVEAKTPLSVAKFYGWDQDPALGAKRFDRAVSDTDKNSTTLTGIMKGLASENNLKWGKLTDWEKTVLLDAAIRQDSYKMQKKDRSGLFGKITKAITGALPSIAGSLLLPGIGTALGKSISAATGGAIGGGIGGAINDGLKGAALGALSGYGTGSLLGKTVLPVTNVNQFMPSWVQQGAASGLSGAQKAAGKASYVPTATRVASANVAPNSTSGFGTTLSNVPGGSSTVGGTTGVSGIGKLNWPQGTLSGYTDKSGQLVTTGDLQWPGSPIPVGTQWSISPSTISQFANIGSIAPKAAVTSSALPNIVGKASPLVSIASAIPSSSSTSASITPTSIVSSPIQTTSSGTGTSGTGTTGSGTGTGTGTGTGSGSGTTGPTPDVYAGGGAVDKSTTSTITIKPEDLLQQGALSPVAWQKLLGLYAA